MDKAPWKVAAFVAVIVPLMGCIATIVAALIGVLPEIIRSTPGAQIPTLTATVSPTPTAAEPTRVLPTPLPGNRSSRVSDVDGMTLLYVPAGEFTMGSNEFADEQPPHQVYLDAFYIDQTEVTNALYAQCVKANACQAPLSTGSRSRSSYYGNPQFDHYPVANAAWNDARAYCQWVGGDLPTEAQWEKAARGPSTGSGSTGSGADRLYPWGNQAPDVSRLNFNWNVGDTTEVGKYPAGASFYGALDMAGNVWEWVRDWYDATYYAGLSSRNPAGPTSGDYRVFRGGAWSNVASYVRASFRNCNDPGNRLDGIGFRCAR